jgi:hypothetical protein
MICVVWFLLVSASFVVDLSGLVVVPIAIALSDGNTLPRWARWWDNDREPLGDAERGAAIAAASGVKRGWLRFVWLAIRNPGNNFGYRCGFIQSALNVTYWCRGDRDTSDQGKPGWLFVRAYRQQCDLSAFCFYAVYRYPRWPTRCLRVMLGWKIHDMVHDDAPAQLVCVINPFMTFEERKT